MEGALQTARQQEHAKITDSTDYRSVAYWQLLEREEQEGQKAA